MTRALCTCIAAALLLTACNVIQQQGKRYEARLEAAHLEWKEVELPAHQLGYWVGGTPDGRHRPVLLVHGFGASGLWQWSEQATALARDRTVVMPDLPWFGKSKPKEKDFTIDGQVAAMTALLDHLKLAQVDVVGISYGGIVAYELAALQPARVGRLVLIDSPGREYTLADYEALLKRFDTDDFAKVLIPSDTAGVRRLMALAYDSPPWVPEWAEAQALDTLYKNGRDEQTALLHGLVALIASASQRPGEVKAPALVIWGKNDDVFPLALGERVAKRLGAKLEVVEKAKHFVPSEQPALVTSALRRFFAAASM
ncbi:MAG: alpha/beta hydrolase [Myxococcaceae bacterium]|nr:alpha/beta hydrolase [Myxococcaceae bacterium]